jgi:hypothetical protein
MAAPHALHSAEEDYAENIGPGVGDHAGPEALPPDSEQPEQDAEKSDSCCRAYSFVEVANAEDNRLEKDGQGGAADDGLKLPLQIAAKSEFLTESSGKGERESREAFKKPLGKEPLRGIGSAAEKMGILQQNPESPKRCAQGEVFYDVCCRGPAAAHNIAQTHPSLVDAHADIEHQEPL